MDLREGCTVFGDDSGDIYEIVSPCGSGSFGIVFKVKNAASSFFALKTVNTGWMTPETVDALKNEGALALSIQDENVARVFFFHDGTKHINLPPYMIMEYADGGTLQKLLDERRQAALMFDNNELVSMFHSLALGMRAINSTLVHRDIKPDNILLCNGCLKISDFGLSKVVGAATRSNTFKGINHIKYCAPEAWRSETNVPAMDMYSMAIVFYELATLIHPLTPREDTNYVDAWKHAHLAQVPQNPNEHNGDVSYNLCQLIMKMLSKRPADRYRDWDAVIDRITSGTNDNGSLIDIRLLLEKAESSRHKAEAMRTQEEEARRVEAEQHELFCYSFRAIQQSASQIVDSFNLDSDSVKLKIKEVSDTKLSIGGPHGSVSIYVSRAEKKALLLRDQRILAHGGSSAPSGRGFNLLLVASSDDDMYGAWMALHVTHHPLFNSPDKRPEPFPFHLSELPKELPLIDAMHIYKVTIKAFSPEMLIPLIQEVL